jgi:hypothetical protein
MTDTAAPVQKTDKEIIKELNAGLNLVIDRYEALQAEHKAVEAPWASQGFCTLLL